MAGRPVTVRPCWLNQAAARSTLGSGFAILFAPSALGLAADAVGVVAAWPITLGLALSGLLVLAVAPRVR